MGGERAAIERIRRMIGPAPAGETWIGDDAAVVVPPGGPLLLAADAVVTGVHADLSLTGVDDLGWKALAVNVSDLAAMGGRPLHALVTVAGPPGTDLDALYRGLSEAAAAYGCAVVGGDLVNAPVLVVAVAVTGTVDGAPVLRSGARPGDAVFVTGALGRSAVGLRRLRAAAEGGTPADPSDPAVRAHRRPAALVREGGAARMAGATAMIDVSDGLAADLDQLATASGVGLRLDAIPVAPGATTAEALGGGEDYVLAFCAPDEGGVRAAFAERGLDQPVRVGTCTSEPALRSLGDGPLPTTGYEHGWD